jgi:hypothetical protein
VRQVGVIWQLICGKQDLYDPDRSLASVRVNPGVSIPVLEATSLAYINSRVEIL